MTSSSDKYEGGKIMIEIIDSRNSDQTIKNAKQIGHVDGEKVYIEDYVFSYIKQCIRANKDEQGLILYGRKEIIDKNRTWFVSGVIRIPEGESHKKTIVTEKDWRTINQEAEKFFPGLSVVGLAMIAKEELTFCEARVENTFIHFFREDQTIFLYFDEEEMDGQLYFYEREQLTKQDGFFEYYEKNEQMQNYMLKEQDRNGTIKTGANETSETGNDHATRQFRAMLMQKQKENAHRKTLLFMYSLSAVLTVVIVMIGITIVGNYDQMNHMENALSQLSGQVETGFAQEKQGMDEAFPTSAEGIISSNEIREQVDETSLHQEKNVKDGQIEEVQADTVDSEDTDEQEIVTEEAKEEVATAYEIKKGDTLEKISVRFYGTEQKVKEICELNHIQDQDTILYGQKIVLP